MSTKPPSDDLDRDALYSSADEEPDEYELEPLDETVLTVEQRHTQAILASLHKHVDIDEVMREEERRLETHLLDNLMRDLRFQFRIKHLLWITAIVAILVSVAHYSPWASALLAVIITAGGLLLYLAQKERQHQAALAEHRRRRRGQLQSTSSDAPPVPLPTPDEVPRESLAQTLASICSLRELLVIVAICGILLVVLGSSIGTAATASLLGLVALGGLILQLIGADMPRIVALVWWVLMVVYVVMCVVLAIGP